MPETFTPAEPAEPKPTIVGLIPGIEPIPHTPAWYRAILYSRNQRGLFPLFSRETAEDYQRQYRERGYDSWMGRYPEHLAVVEVPGETWDWMSREQMRFNTGEYVAIPLPPGQDWQHVRYPHHYAHIAHQTPAGDPVMIAYTPNDNYGRRDRQIRVRPGRYLAQFYPEVSNQDRIDWVTKIDAKYAHKELKITDDSDLIGRIYATSDIRSCMAESAQYFGGTHPCTAYGAPGDTALAYVGEDGAWTARCVIWPAKKIVGIIYGDDSHILKQHLRDAGYSTGDWTGARIRAIRNNRGNLMCPYVDGADTVDLSDCGKFLILDGPDGTFDCRITGGFTEEARLTCDNCNDSFTPGDSDSSAYCQHCYEESWCCEGCDETRFDDSYGEDASYCRSCWYDRTTACEHCSDRFEPDQIDSSDAATRAENGTEEYCLPCSSRRRACADCGTVELSRDLDDDTHCSDCHVVESEQADESAVTIETEGT